MPSIAVDSKLQGHNAKICLTARAFADTNIVIYAEGSDADKAQRATAILESGAVISAQVINEVFDERLTVINPFVE